jgi:hypothetical protein
MKYLLLLLLFTGQAFGQGFNMPTGQEPSSLSLPVVIASDQSPVAVTGSGTPGTPAGGVVSIQGVTGGTPVPVTSTPPTTTSATFQDGSIAFGSLTTSFATVITTGGTVKHVDMRNNTNQPVAISLNSGSTTSYSLDAGDQVSLDLSSNGVNIPSGTTLEAKYTGSAPTTGSVHINAFY